jgi:hypothetical protein
MERLPEELIRIVDDYVDCRTNSSLKASCGRFYKFLRGKDLTHVHISGQRVRPAVLEGDSEEESDEDDNDPLDHFMLYSGVCGCQQEGRSVNWREHTCQRRFLQINRHIRNLSKHGRVLEHVRSVSTRLNFRWTEEQLIKVLTVCPNIRVVELDFPHDRSIATILEWLIRAKRKFDHLEEVEFRFVPSVNVPLHASLLRTFVRHFPKVKAAKLLIMGNDTIQVYRDVIGSLKELEWLSLTVLYSRRTARFIAPCLLGLKKLKYLTLPGQVENLEAVTWIPPNLEELTFTPTTMDDAPAKTETNGQSVKRLTIHGKIDGAIEHCRFNQLEHLTFSNWMHLTFLQDEEPTYYSAILNNIDPTRLRSLCFDPTPITDDVLSMMRMSAKSLECIKITVSDSCPQGIGGGITRLLDGLNQVTFPLLRYLFLGTDVLFSHREIDSNFWNKVYSFFSDKTLFPLLHHVNVGANRLDGTPSENFVVQLPSEQQLDPFAIPLPTGPKYKHYKVILGD